MMNEELKPCPFCGGEAELIGGTENWTPTYDDPDSGGDPVAVVCNNCSCGLYGTFWDYGDAEKAWNNRVPDTNIPADRLQEICEAEKDGRLVVLPIWNVVYIISGGEIQPMDMVHYRGNCGGIYDMRCECQDQQEDCDSFCHNDNEKACAYNFRVAEIGKTVFLDREAAQDALKEAKE